MITDKKVLYTNFRNMADIDLANIIEVAQMVIKDKEKESELATAFRL